MLVVVLVALCIWFGCIWPIGGYLHCCNNDNLAACLRSHHDAAEIKMSRIAQLKNSITMFTYETDNIVDYALYSFAVNNAYANYRNFDLVLTTSRNGFEFENRDQRWNKVKIMENFINEMRKDHMPNRFRDKYLVWLDSDLIFFNFELNLADLVAQYPSADLIISADVEPLNGMVNTGCMIVRVSQWSQSFFQEWWDATDRVNGMDQHVFDMLYRRRKHAEQISLTTDGEQIDRKIAILPTYALNSHIPASKHQEPHHNILHLAGESAVVRAHIFKKAYEEVCRAHALSLQKDGITLNPAYLSPQLGLTRPVLQTIDYTAVLREALKSIWNEMLVCGENMPPLHLDTADDRTEKEEMHTCGVEHVLKLQGRLRDTMQSRNLALLPTTTTGMNATSTATSLWDLYRKALRWSAQAHARITAEYAHTTARDTTLYSSQIHLEHLQNCLDAAFELLSAEMDPTIVQNALSDAAKVLHVIRTELVRSEDSSSYAPALYYQFKYFDFLAIYYKSIHMPTKELESLQQARTVWEEMASFHFYGSGNTISDPYRELAGVLARMAQVECREGVHYSDTDDSRFERGLKLVQHSIELTAGRWLPNEVFNRIKNYIQGYGTENMTNEMKTLNTALLLTTEQLKGVPIKVLHILAHNYHQAASCARHLTGSTSSDINIVPLYLKYGHICSQLCSILSTMGEACSFERIAESGNVAEDGSLHTMDGPSSDSPPELQSANTVSKRNMRDTRTVKLKRKKKAT